MAGTALPSQAKRSWVEGFPGQGIPPSASLCPAHSEEDPAEGLPADSGCSSSPQIPPNKITDLACWLTPAGNLSWAARNLLKKKKKKKRELQ